MRRGNRVGMLIAMGMMLVLCSVLFSGVEKQGKDSSPQKAKDTFYYNGDNIKEYRGESIF